MAIPYWIPVAIAVAVVALTYGVQLLLAEVFPWQMLRAHKHGKPTVTTESYAGRTVLITGANGAYGSRAAKMFATREVSTLVLVDLLDCTKLKEEIEADLDQGKKKPTILVWQVDMMSYASCQELGKKVRALRNLDHCLMTAGILAFKRKESPQGWENTIQINYISTALIAVLILPALKSSPSNPNPPVMTFVTSFGIYPASPTLSVPRSGSYLKHLSNNKDGMAQAHQYGRSKALLLYFARELAARSSAAAAKGKGVPVVTVNSADPGPAWTPLTQPNQDQLIPRLIQNYGSRDPKYGAAALVNGASATKDGHGQIMMDFTTGPYPPFMERQSGRKTQQRVWDETREELAGKASDVKAVYEMLDA